MISGERFGVASERLIRLWSAMSPSCWRCPLEVPALRTRRSQAAPPRPVPAVPVQAAAPVAAAVDPMNGSARLARRIPNLWEIPTNGCVVRSEGWKIGCLMYISAGKFLVTTCFDN